MTRHLVWCMLVAAVGIFVAALGAWQHDPVADFSPWWLVGSCGVAAAMFAMMGAIAGGDPA